MSLHLEAAGRTDVGRLRGSNEDALLVEPELGLFAVADGMGGHAAGEVASRLAVEALRESCSEGGAEDGEKRLSRAFLLANERIRDEMAGRSEYQGMGTTLVATRILQDAALVANVGDSRSYLIRGDTIRQVTTDHSWVREQVDSGRLEPHAAANHPYRNVITRALGSRGEVDVDLHPVALAPGDWLLLCSDGLTVMVSDEEILDIVSGTDSPEAGVEDLVEAANEAGGEDNITVVLVHVVGVGSQASS